MGICVRANPFYFQRLPKGMDICEKIQWNHQDLTSQNHFCSVKLFRPRWRGIFSHPEHEADPKIQFLGSLIIAHLWMSGLKCEDCIGNVSSVWQHKVALLDNPSSFVHYFSSFESTNIPSYAIWNLTQPSKLVSHCVFVNFLSNLALNYDFEVLYFGVATFHFFNERSISSLTLSNLKT